MNQLNQGMEKGNKMHQLNEAREAMLPKEGTLKGPHPQYRAEDPEDNPSWNQKPVEHYAAVDPNGAGKNFPSHPKLRDGPAGGENADGAATTVSWVWKTVGNSE